MSGARRERDGERGKEMNRRGEGERELKGGRESWFKCIVKGSKWRGNESETDQ